MDERFKVLLIGAGEINFGSVEGPWNHSKRLERIFGPRLKVLGIIDPDVARAVNQIEWKRARLSDTMGAYNDAQVWASLEEALPDLKAYDTIDLGVLGIPPHFRGGTSAPEDLDLRLIKELPHVKHWLVEKPVSAREYSDSKDSGQLAVCEAYERLSLTHGVKVGVGYQFTALKAVLKLQEILKSKNLKVMATEARYNMAYEFARKPAWYNKSVSCGPIVEQATHFASLSLLFGGKPLLPTVRAHTVIPSGTPGTIGHLSKLGIDESLIPESDRIPRYTSAVWRYASGAVGSLSHSIALHGKTYDTEFEVICDGLIAKLVDLYTDKPKLLVYEDGNARPHTYIFENDDPYQTQIEQLLAGTPTCTYRQALDTYALTWSIRLAGEKEAAELIKYT